MRFLLFVIIFLFSSTAFSQREWPEDEKRFCGYETKGDSCKALGNVEAAKEFYSKALSIRSVCRVQQKYNELGKLPVKTCPDVKTYTDLCTKMFYYLDKDKEKSDSLKVEALMLKEEIFYGIPETGLQFEIASGPNERNKSATEDPMKKMLEDAFKELEKMMGGGSLDSLLMDTTSINPGDYMFSPAEDPELAGDRVFKEGDYQMAKLYFEAALNERPKDKVLKRKISECNKQLKKKKER